VGRLASRLPNSANSAENGSNKNGLPVDRYAPNLDFRSNLAQYILYQVVLSHRNAAGETRM